MNNQKSDLIERLINTFTDVEYMDDKHIIQFWISPEEANTIIEALEMLKIFNEAKKPRNIFNKILEMLK